MWEPTIAAKVDDALSKGADRTEEWVTAEAMADFFAAVGILLVRKNEDAEGSGEEFVVQGCGKVEFAGAVPELDLIVVEGMRGIFAGDVTVLAGPHEKIEGNDDKVGNGLAGFVGSGVQGHELRKVV
jgi:hypothetical protein